MKKIYIIIITIVSTIVVLILLGPFIKGPNTVTVLSRESYYIGAWKEYYLAIPGNRSTCTWNYVQDGSPGSFTSQPDPQTGQHTFEYNSSLSRIEVTCLNDQGIQYSGSFQIK